MHWPPPWCEATESEKTWIQVLTTICKLVTSANYLAELQLSPLQSKNNTNLTPYSLP